MCVRNLSHNFDGAKKHASSVFLPTTPDATTTNVVHHHHVVLILVHRHVMHQKGQVTFGLEENAQLDTFLFFAIKSATQLQKYLLKYRHHCYWNLLMMVLFLGLFLLLLFLLPPGGDDDDDDDRGNVVVVDVVLVVAFLLLKKALA